MSKAPDRILNVHFTDIIHVGGSTIEHWSVGGSTQLFKQIEVEDKGPLGVLLKFNGGTMQHEITVPLHMIRQITRDVKK